MMEQIEPIKLKWAVIPDEWWCKRSFKEALPLDDILGETLN